MAGPPGSRSPSSGTSAGSPCGAGVAVRRGLRAALRLEAAASGSDAATSGCSTAIGGAGLPSASAAAGRSSAPPSGSSAPGRRHRQVGRRRHRRQGRLPEPRYRRCRNRRWAAWRRARRGRPAAPRRGAAGLPASYSRIDPATAALSDSMRPCIGMRTSRSHRRRTAGPRPRPSLPTTITIGPRRSASRAVSGASPSAPTIRRPRAWRSARAPGRSSTGARRRCSTAPADALPLPA